MSGPPRCHRCTTRTATRGLTHRYVCAQCGPETPLAPSMTAEAEEAAIAFDNAVELAGPDTERSGA